MYTDNKVAQKKQTFSIRLIITVLFSVLFSVALISILSMLFLRTEVAIQSLSKRLNQSVATQVEQRFSLLMTPVKQLFWSTSVLSEQLSKEVQTIQHLKNILVKTVQQNSHIYSASFVFEDGRSYSVKASPDLHLVYQGRKRDHYTRVNYAENGQVIKKTRVNKPVKNLVKQALYQAVKKQQGLVTLESSELAESKQKGYSVATPVYNQRGALVGVLSIDIVTQGLNTMLQETRVSKHSVLALVDYSNKPKLVGSSFDRYSVENFNLIKSFFEFSSNQEYNKVMIDGLIYYLTATRVNAQFFPKWYCFIAMPEKELLAEILTVQRQSFGIGIGVLVCAIALIFVFSKLLTSPIKVISNQATRIKHLEEVPQLNIKTPVKEVEELIQSINSMGVAFDAFSHYVPKSIVKHLIDTNQKAYISGESFHVTLLFTDIKDFTSYSDHENPEQVSRYLSEYFEAISNIILKYSGTIDKYIGDSVMAFWGAPKIISNQYVNAAHCILEIYQKLKSPEFQEHPVLSKFDTRFALHCGNVVVGNIGSRDRFNYTAIGREVNLCSRLEAVNKRFNTHLLISDPFKKMLGPEFVTRPLDNVLLKGFSEPVMTHELLGYNQVGDNVSKYLECHDDFMNQDYLSAKNGFLALKKKSPEDKTLDYFIDACNEKLS